MGQQSSLVYNEKQHGIFTYYLLKKLQESKGVLKYKELSDYLTTEVALRVTKLFTKDQTPVVSISPDVIGVWEN